MQWTNRKSFFAGFVSGILTLVLLVVVGLFITANFFRDKIVERKAGQLEAPALSDGAMARYEWAVVDSGGVEHQMNEFRNKSILLQFWSPECMACEAEIPAMNAMYEATKDSGLEIIAVAMDVAPPQLPEVAAEMGIRYPIYALSGTVPDVFKFTAGPATFVVNPAGMIVMRHLGAAKWDDPQVVAWLKLVGSGTAMAAL